MTTTLDNNNRMKWFREARFGMIIHWGIYSIPAGEWKGQKMDYIGEWIMSKYKIPIAEYEKLTEQFNPVCFNADEWVSLAKNAGMKYIIFTAKHHDGFAMYHSGVDPYNIVDASPFGRDPVAELANACRKYDVKLCLYYSQALDWHEHDAGGTEPGDPLNFGMSWGNDWDYPNHNEKVFSHFFEKKVKPQIRELLTKYGPIGMIWFDCPLTINREQCEELFEFVRSLQSECIINSRLGHGLGDYESLGDNEIPAVSLKGDWETIATMNDTWGYKKDDNNWKSTRDILTLLTGLAGKNVNYALNIGPTEKGLFPEASINVLKEIAVWMDKNSEAIHSTLPTPFPHDLGWGPVTRKPGKLYLHLHKWPGGNISLNGLHNTIKKAYILSNKDHMLDIIQKYIDEWQLHTLEVKLPESRPDEIIPVLVLEIEGEPVIEEGLIQQADGSVYLPADAARIHRDLSGNSGTHDSYDELPVKIEPDGEVINSGGWTDINPGGVVINWLGTDIWMSWKFKIYTKGRYTVRVVSSGLFHSNPWKGGHKVRIETAGQVLCSVIDNDEEIINTQTRCYSQAASICGDIIFDSPGVYALNLKADEIKPNDGVGFAVMAVQLMPVYTCT